MAQKPGGQAPDQGDQSVMAKLEHAAGMTGLRIYDKGQWGLVRSSVTNPSASTRNPLLLINYEAVPEPQYGTRVWMPPRSRRRVVTPITPFGLQAEAKQGVEIRVRLVDDSGPNERARPASPGTLIGPGQDNPLRSAMFAPSSDPAPGDLVKALRLLNGQGKTNFTLNARFAPMRPAIWQSLDVLMLADSPPRLGSAQIRAMRQWLYSGGRLWIMLDQVGTELPKRLLGDDWDLAVLDRIGLSDFTITGNTRSGRSANKEASGRDSTASRAVRSDYPYDLVRVVPGQFTVIHTAGGYPASLTKRVGQGQVLVTTLHADAWLVDHAGNGSTAGGASIAGNQGGDKLSDTPSAKDPQSEAAAGQAGPALQDLGWMYDQPPGVSGRRPQRAGARANGSDTGIRQVDQAAHEGTGQSASTSLSALGPYMTEQVGVDVLGRPVVLIVLGLFTLGLLIGGLVLIWRGRLEWIGMISAILAVVAAIVLVGMGYAHGRQNPPVLAASAVVDAPTDSPVTQMHGMTSVYRPAGATGQARLNVSGLMPVISDQLQSNGPLRLIFTDLEQWTFDNLDLAPKAVHTVRLQGTQSVDQPIGGWITFTQSGIDGQINSEAFGPLGDPLLLAASARLAPNISDTGAIAAEPEQATLGEDQTIQAGVLSQEQIERSRVYRALLKKQTSNARSGAKSRLNRPLLYAWSTRLPGVSISLSASAQRRISSLLRVPMEIRTPEPNQPFTVPAGFVEMAAYRGGTGSGETLSTTAYDPKTKSFLVLSQAQTIMMRFTLPRAVQSMNLDQCVFHVDLKAPNRPYDVVTLGDGKIKTLSSGSGGNGRFEVRLNADDLPLKREGQIIIGLKIGPSESGDQSLGQGDRYQIREMGVSATGTMPK